MNKYLSIPLKTLWKQGDPLEAPGKYRKGTIRLHFGGGIIPLPNLFGDDKVTIYNRSYNDVAGFGLVVKRGEYDDSDHSIYIIIDIVKVPDEDPSSLAIPILAILGVVAGLIGGVLILAALSKIEAIFDLPVFWLVAGVAALAFLPAAVKSIKGAAAG